MMLVLITISFISASQSSSDDGKSPVSLPSPVDVQSDQLSHKTDMTSNHSESQRLLSDSAIQSNEPKTDKAISHVYFTICQIN
jgi:hypothetical protein